MVSNTIVGTAAGEWLTGTNGDDFVLGKGGQDDILGGLGSDRLVGGSGVDTFHFIEGERGVDTIADFSNGPGHDLIDLSLVGRGLYWIGRTNVFTGHAGEVRVDDWNTVRVDTDGDGHADFRLNVIGADVHGYELILA